jgi:hypothetical protein
LVALAPEKVRFAVSLAEQWELIVARKWLQPDAEACGSFEVEDDPIQCAARLGQIALPVLRDSGSERLVPRERGGRRVTRY